jgi:hypothetical protein
MLPGGGAGVVLYAPVTPAGSAAACTSQCSANACCLAQHRASNSSCRIGGVFAANNSGNGQGYSVYYKKSGTSSPAAISRATFTTGQKSNQYNRCGINSADINLWLCVGVTLNPLNLLAPTVPQVVIWRASANAAACISPCSASASCWGFIHDGTNNRCAFKSGVPDSVWTTYLS